MKNGLSIDQLETFWTLLAKGITTAGPERETIFLTKLTLLLANELGDLKRLAALIEQAGKDQRPRTATQLASDS